MPAYQLPTGERGGQGDPVSPIANNPFLQQIMGHPGFQGATQSGLSAADTQALAQFVNSQPGGAQFFSGLPGMTPEMGTKMLQSGMSPQQFQAFIQSAMKGSGAQPAPVQPKSPMQPMGFGGSGKMPQMPPTSGGSLTQMPQMGPGRNWSAMGAGGVSSGFGGMQAKMPNLNIPSNQLASFGRSNPFQV